MRQKSIDSLKTTPEVNRVAKVEQRYRTSKEAGSRKIDLFSIAQRQSRLLIPITEKIRQRGEKAGNIYSDAELGWLHLAEASQNRNTWDENSSANSTYLYSFLRASSFTDNPANFKKIYGYSQKDFKDLMAETQIGQTRKKGFQKLTEPKDIVEEIIKDSKKDLSILNIAYIPSSEFSKLEIKKIIKAIETGKTSWRRSKEKLAELSTKADNFEAKKYTLPSGKEINASKYDLSQPKEFRKYLAETTRAHIDSILENQTSELTSKRSGENIPPWLEKISSEDNLSRIRQETFSQHLTRKSWNGAELYKNVRGWIGNGRLSKTEVTDTDIAVGFAFNNPTGHQQACKLLGLDLNVDPERIRVEVQKLPTTKYKKFAKDMLHTYSRANKDGAFDLQTDVAMSIMEHKFASLESTETRPNFKLESFPNDGLSTASREDLAVLLVHGYKAEQLKGKGATEDNLIQTQEKYLTRDDETKPWEFKKAENDTDYNKEIEDKKKITTKQKNTAKTKVRATLKNTDETVSQEYKSYLTEQIRLLVIATHPGINTDQVTTWRKHYESEYFNSDGSVNTYHTNYNSYMDQVKNKMIIDHDDTLELIDQKAQELAQKEVEKYKSKNMKKYDNKKISAHKLTSLIEKGKITPSTITTDLPPSIQTEIANLQDSSDRLDINKILDLEGTASSLSAQQLSILSLLLDTFGSAILNELGEEKNQELEELFT